MHTKPVNLIRKDKDERNIKKENEENFTVWKNK